MWSFALTGNLKHAHFVFTKPRYNTALITSVSFSNQPIE
jgi:hypothetical protein